MFTKPPSSARYDDRQAPRLPLALPVWLIFGDRRETGHIINLSATGAKVFTHAKPQPGQAITLEWSQQSYACLCIWTTTRLCGMTFNQPLSDRDLARMLR